MNELDEFLRVANAEGQKISLDDVRFWLSSDNLELQGALNYYLGKQSFFTRIAPPLPKIEALEFILAYSARCLRENPNTDWTDSRYEACRGVVVLFRHYWELEESRQLDRIKQWIAIAIQIWQA